jgi:hypothetical protein
VIRAASLLFSLLVATSFAQSHRDLSDWPPPNPDLADKKVMDYWDLYTSRLKRIKGVVTTCIDEFNGLVYQCKKIKVNQKLDNYGTEAEILSAYLPPYRAVLPRLRLRVLLEQATHRIRIPNQYIALVPLRFIKDGPTVSRIWKRLAASAQPFGCKHVLCDVMYFSNEPAGKHDEEEEEAKWAISSKMS